MAEAPSTYRLAGSEQETHDTWTLRLEPAAGEAGDAFAPGQFAMLYAFGVGEAPISISRIEDGVLVHTVRAVGAVTRALCAARPGDEVGVRGPFGVPWPVAEADGRDVVVLAGGIGLAPLRPVVDALLERRERLGAVNVLYGGRSPAELLYVAELERWRSRFDVTVEVTVDAPATEWRGPVGVVTKLLPRATYDPGRAIAMVCGPEVMMRFAADALEDAGVPRASIWVSLERSMKCAVGHCGHCQLGPLLLCRDGAVVGHERAAPLLRVAEL